MYLEMVVELNFIHNFKILKSNREQLRKYNHKPSGRTRTCGPVIPVRRSNH